MTKPAVQSPDLERRAVDILTSLLADDEPDLPIGVGGAANPRVQVSLDGTPGGTWPVNVVGTIRLVAYGPTTTEAKRLARLAQGRLLAHPAFTALTGVLPSRDPDTDEEIAAVTVRYRARTESI